MPSQSDNGIKDYKNDDSGYIEFKNGLILQWGITEIINPDRKEYVTFPKAFKTKCINAQASFIQDGAMYDHGESFGVGNITNIGMDIENQYIVDHALRGYLKGYWFAIGY